MTDLFQAISNFGFPIVVAGYLLFRFENKIDNFGSLISNLEKTMQELVHEVKNLREKK